MEVKPLGDSAVLIRVTEDFDDAPERALEKVLAAQQSLVVARIPGAIEVAPAHTTVSLFYDPMMAVEAGAPVENVFGWLETQVRKAMGKSEDIAKLSKTSVIEIPV